MIKAETYIVCACVLMLVAVTSSGQSRRSIRSVDFRNFNYQSGGTEFVLSGGTYSEGSEAAWFRYSLSEVSYVDFDSDGVEEAFVILDYETSGTLSRAQDYYVFAHRRRGEPRVIFHEWREKPWEVRVVGRSIIVVSPFWVDGGLCCPSGLETSVYRWRGSLFVRVSRKRRYIDTPEWWLQRRA